MAEGNDTPGGEPGRGAPRSEGDLLAERRARRAAESGEVALTRRAEAAEATVQTLERHVASLQQRLREAEDTQRQLAESLDLERSAALEREHELRRVKQREYAEQQLRVEAEERLGGVDRESRIEIERIAARLDASEDEVGGLAERLETVQEQLASAAQAGAAERTAIRRGELDLQARVAELERRGSETQLGLERERAARERAESMIASMRDGYRQLGGLLGDLKGILERVIAGSARAPVQLQATASTPPPAAPPATYQAPAAPLPAGGSPRAAVPPPAPVRTSFTTPVSAPARGADPAFKPRSVTPEEHGAEMADALAAAVERLRARAEVAPEFPEDPPPAPAAPARAGATARVQAAPHKHSMSLITRVRRWRKQRRSR